MGSRLFHLLLLFVCLSVVCAKEEPTSVPALMEAGHWKRARLIVESRLRVNDADARSHAWLSKIRSSFGDLDGAVEEGERAVALDAKVADFHGQLAEACALKADRSNMIRGLVYVRRMKTEIASALALDGRHVDTLLVKMMFAFKAPAIVGGSKQEAREVADQIVKISPAWGYLAHARLLETSGDDTATERALRKALEADPRFYRTRVAMARFYCCTAKSPRLELAEDAARSALALDGGAEGAYDILARVYAAGRRWAELDALLARAEKAVPDDRSPYFAAASVLADAGLEPGRAARYVETYLGQEPEGKQPSRAEAEALLKRLRRS